MKRLALLALATLAWVWLAASVQVSAYAPRSFPLRDQVVIHNDRGGLWTDFTARARAWEASGTRIVLSGSCDSACTAYTLSRTACVLPTTQLRFHGPYNTVATPGVDPAYVHALMERMILNDLPPRIAAWVQSRNALADYHRWHVLTGPELFRLVPLCR